MYISLFYYCIPSWGSLYIFPFMYMYIFGPISIQVLFITWYLFTSLSCIGLLDMTFYLYYCSHLSKSPSPHHVLSYVLCHSFFRYYSHFLLTYRSLVFCLRAKGTGPWHICTHMDGTHLIKVLPLGLIILPFQCQAEDVLEEVPSALKCSNIM
jgi:hypothetical protein